MVQIAKFWKDYACLDAGNGEKLERWGQHILRRPDPQAVWPCDSQSDLWKQAEAVYHRSKQGGGSWEFLKPLPDQWQVTYGDLTFKVTPTGFKHTGIFPEQAVNWDWMSACIQESSLKEIRILNLFAYTGCATMACAHAGATEVVHVDASKGMVTWAKENMALSHLQNAHIRFIVDDCMKFIQREKRRGRTYQGILMDPPSYGRGPNGEMFRFEDQVNELVREAASLLSDDALFFLVNAYTTGFSSTVLQNVLELQLPSGQLESGEIGLPIETRNLVLPCGIYGKWTR